MLQAVDTENETAVHQALDKVLGQRAIILIFESEDREGFIISANVESAVALNILAEILTKQIEVLAQAQIERATSVLN